MILSMLRFLHHCLFLTSLSILLPSIRPTNRSKVRTLKHLITLMYSTFISCLTPSSANHIITLNHLLCEPNNEIFTHSSNTLQCHNTSLSLIELSLSFPSQNFRHSNHLAHLHLNLTPNFHYPLFLLRPNILAYLSPLQSVVTVPPDHPLLDPEISLIGRFYHFIAPLTAFID